MNKCQICGKQFEKRISLEKHVGTSYGKEKIKIHVPLLAYMANHEGRKEFSKENLHRMYIKESGTTPVMSDELQVNKTTLLTTMHYYGIKLRSRSKATKNQIQRDGLWNKGKTKLDHPSIMEYAKTRRGKDNPYYTAPGFEERQRKNRERFLGVHRQQCHKRMPKSTEGRMVKILDAAGMQYLRNFCIKHPGGTWRLYDFLIEGTLIIEMQGNYYHANPKMYGPDDEIVVSSKRRKATDIWEYDADKEQLARQHGYNCLNMWEDDFIGMADKEVLNSLRSKICEQKN